MVVGGGGGERGSGGGGEVGGGDDWQGAGIRPHPLLTAAVTRLWLRKRSRACGWEGGHEAVAGKAVTRLWLRRRSRGCG